MVPPPQRGGRARRRREPPRTRRRRDRRLVTCHAAESAVSAHGGRESDAAVGGRAITALAVDSSLVVVGQLGGQESTVPMFRTWCADALAGLLEAHRGAAQTGEGAPPTCQRTQAMAVSCLHAGMTMATRAGRKRECAAGSAAHLGRAFRRFQVVSEGGGPLRNRDRGRS